MSIARLQEYGLEPMDDDAIREFVSSQSTGVLGLPMDGAPYLLPMSFAFDGNSSLYFTYLLGSSSRKETLSERSDHARFLVYSVETMFNWRSVLLTGELTEVPESEWSELEDILTTAWRPELFRTVSTSADVSVYEFPIQSQSGIRHTGLASGFREGVEFLC
jgi:nitroimidazol reductase NimA-like FMN-containing flavoprotein (pyridoxamine 5'-phosphate oxidase superfamily)